LGAGRQTVGAAGSWAGPFRAVAAMAELSDPDSRQDPSSVGLAAALRMLRRRWRIIAVFVVLGVVGMAAEHERSTKSYTANASVAFQNATLPEAELGIAAGGGVEPQREANTEVLTAHSAEVAAAVARQLNLKATPHQLLESVKAETAPTANVIQISASTPNPNLSAQLANAFAEQYIAFRSRAQLAGVQAAQSRLRANIERLAPGSPERVALEQTLQRLTPLLAVAGGGAEIIDRATPPSAPSGLTLSSSIAIGLLIGLALGLGVAFVVEALDRRLRTLEEVERAYDLPALAAIPRFPRKASRAAARAQLLEPHRILRAALDFAAAVRPISPLMVTSAVPGEGKTTVAVDLAHAIALGGREVALVELDLRHPTFAQQFELDPGVGLTQTIIEGREVGQLLQRPLSDCPQLAVLPAGPLPPNPSELLGSATIAQLLGWLGERFGMVVIDSAPLNPVADAQVMLDLPAVPGVLLVARVGVTSRDEVARARAILERHKVEPLGLVVNGLIEADRYGYGAYAGGSGQPAAKPAPRSVANANGAAPKQRARRRQRTR